MRKKKEIKYRNKILRKYIIGRNWDENPEFMLVQDVVKNLKIRKPELVKYKYVFNYEWEVKAGHSDKGKGDLLFTDGKDNFLVVECKNKNSQEVRKQTLRYMKAIKKNYPKVNIVEGLVVTPGPRYDYTNDHMYIWNLDLSEEDKHYYFQFDDLKDPNEIKLRDMFQKVYKEMGHVEKNPINALQELKDESYITIDYKKPTNLQPPFEWEVKIKFLKNFPNINELQTLKYSLREKDLRKKDAKAMAAARMCNQIYLPYHILEWKRIKELLKK